jgi:hypothetical protein
MKSSNNDSNHIFESLNRIKKEIDSIEVHFEQFRSDLIDGVAEIVEKRIKEFNEILKSEIQKKQNDREMTGTSKLGKIQGNNIKNHFY